MMLQVDEFKAGFPRIDLVEARGGERSGCAPSRLSCQGSGVRDARRYLGLVPSSRFLLRLTCLAGVLSITPLVCRHSH